jgi:hypothetical protein
MRLLRLKQLESPNLNSSTTLEALVISAGIYMTSELLSYVPTYPKHYTTTISQAIFSHQVTTVYL